MFELNTNITIQTTNIGLSTVYIVDNIFKNPEEIKNWVIKKEPRFLWKGTEKPSYNGKYFIDKRQKFIHDSIIDLNTFISSICGETPVYKNLLFSNITKLNNCEFNNYRDNYWYPHVDPGFNGLVYLNEEDTSGTNIYSRVIDDGLPPLEHYHSWKNKTNFKLLHTIKSKFNRLAVFDGRLFHGMAIDDDTYFNTTRINLVSFYKGNI